MARSNTGSNLNYLSAALDAAAQKGASTALSVSAWIKPTSTAVTSNLSYMTTSGSSYFGVTFDGANGYGFGAARMVVDTGNGQASTSTALGSAVWAHGCSTRNTSADISVYLNGGSKGTTLATVGGAFALTNNLALGALNDGAGGIFSPLNGDLAEIAWWDATLTDAEVLSLSKGVSPLLIQPSKLFAYYPLRAVSGGSPNHMNRLQTTALAQTGTMGASTTHAPVFSYNQVDYEPASAAVAATKSPYPFRSTSPRRFQLPAGFSKGIRR